MYKYQSARAAVLPAKCLAVILCISGCASTAPALTANPAMKPAAMLGELEVAPVTGAVPGGLSQQALATMAAALEVKPDGSAVTWTDTQGAHRLKILVSSTEGELPCRMLDVDHKAMTACRLSSGWVVR